MCTRKNVTPVIEYSDSECSDVEAIIYSDPHKRFINYFSMKSVHEERGFIYHIEEDNFGFPGDMGRIIKTLK